MDGNDPVEARFDLAARFYDTFNFFTEQFASKTPQRKSCTGQRHILEIGVGD